MRPGYLSTNELLRVVFPPLVLIIAVLGSILGGITNPTPAAALGAGGAIMLAAYRKLADENRSGRLIIWTTFAVVIMILVGVNFDLRIGLENVALESWIAYIVAQAAYLFAIFGLFYALWVLFAGGVLTPVVRETAKVTLHGLYDPDRFATVEPGGDFFWRRTLHPNLSSEL